MKMGEKKMLKRKAVCFFLAAMLIFGGISGEAADLQSQMTEQEETQTSLPTQNTAESEGQTEPESDTQTEGEGQTEPESDAQTETEGEGQTEPESGAQTETEGEGQTESESDAQTETEEESQTEPESGVQTEPESDTQSFAENPGETETQTEMQDLPQETGETNVLETAELTSQAPRATQTYYAGYQVRLDGNLDTEGALAGLTFSLYEKAPQGDWQLVKTAQSKFSAYYQLSYVYFTWFQLEGSPVNEYKVVMEGNSSYSMAETVVQLDPSSLAQICGSAIAGNYLNLTPKEVPKDNTDIQVSLGSPSWGGSGTPGDPYTWAVTVDRFTDEITIKTANAQATILWQGNAYVGEMTAELPYDESSWNFSVKSSDGTRESFFAINVTRTKYTPLGPNTLISVTPSQIGGRDGKIQGLKADRLYEYCSESEKASGIYHQVPAGSTEITGLEAGTYYVRFQETWEYEPSLDTTVKISDPISHKIILPPENVPAGVEILECPSDMAEGHNFTLRFRLPKNHLLEKVSYSGKAGGITIEGTLPKNTFQYSLDGDTTVVTITHKAFSYDITLKISLLGDEYYEATSFSGNGEAADERGAVTLAGDETIQGNVHYFKQGVMTATVKVSESWKGYAKVSSLKAYRKGTKDEVAGTLTQISDEKWSLEINLDSDVEIYYDFVSYPADLTALNQIVEKIGDLEQYVDNSARQTMKVRLELLSAYQNQPLKNQSMVDGYVTLLEEAYQDLVPRQDLSDHQGVIISLDEWERAYDGTPWTPKLTVECDGTVLTEGVDYRIIFPEDMVSPGEKQIVVEFIGAYMGQRTVCPSIIQYFTITASAGKHGSIEPAGEITVRAGESQRFLIIPDEGYRIQAVYVDGEQVSLTGEKEYLFQNISQDGVIEAVFEAEVSETDDSETEGFETEDPETNASETTEKTETEKKDGTTAAAQTQNEAVDTGDTSQPLLCIIIMFLSMVVVWIAARKKFVINFEVK